MWGPVAAWRPSGQGYSPPNLGNSVDPSGSNGAPPISCECPECGQVGRAQTNGDVANGMFGPQLVAAVASLHGRFRLTEREIVVVVESL